MFLLLANHLPTILLFGREVEAKTRTVIINVGVALFLITYLIIILLGYATYLDYERKYYFANEDRIERITGVRLPNMDIVEYNKGKSSFTGDYSDRLYWSLKRFLRKECIKL